MLPVFAFLAVSHVLLLFAARGGARLLKFAPEDRVAAMFLGAQKTLALGVPMIAIYFSGQPELLATAPLPIIFYHPFQLLVAGVIRALPGLHGPHREEDHETT